MENNLKEMEIEAYNWLTDHFLLDLSLYKLFIIAMKLCPSSFLRPGVKCAILCECFIVQFCQVIVETDPDSNGARKLSGLLWRAHSVCNDVVNFCVLIGVLIHKSVRQNIRHNTCAHVPIFH